MNSTHIQIKTLILSILLLEERVNVTLNIFFKLLPTLTINLSKHRRDIYNNLGNLRLI